MKPLPSLPPLTEREQIALTLDERWESSPPDSSYPFHIEQILTLLQQHKTHTLLQTADLGCGDGALSQLIGNLGGKVVAIDGSKKALQTMLPNENVTVHHDILPSTLLQDTSFDCVICKDVIGELPTRHHRLLMSEMSRVVKKSGVVVSATALDIHSTDALERFVALFQTEFDILETKVSYHALFEQCPSLFKKFFDRKRIYQALDRMKLGQPSYVILIGQKKPFCVPSP